MPTTTSPSQVSTELVQSDHEASQINLPTSTKKPPDVTKTPTSFITTTSTTTSINLTPGSFTGIGNRKIDIAARQEPSLISFTHNGEGSFEVLSYAVSGEPLSTLLDATGAYTGRQIINAGGIQYSAIEIRTNGSWRVEIQPLSNAVLLELPSTVKSKNSEVFRLDRMIYEITLDTMNANGWVSVIGYGENGYFSIILNEVAPFKKTVTIKDPDITFLEISSLGNWILDIR